MPAVTYVHCFNIILIFSNLKTAAVIQFLIRRSLKLGDALSSLLLHVALENAIRKAYENQEELEVNAYGQYSGHYFSLAIKEVNIYKCSNMYG
jgi:hypothetical protein